MNRHQAWLRDKRLPVAALALLVAMVYYHSLFHIPRADQLIYLYRAAFPAYDDLWSLTIGAYAFNRSDSVGDFVLFRPVLYFLLELQRWAWGYNFFLWQATSLLLHVAVVLSLFFYLCSIERKSNLFPFVFSLFFGVLLAGTEMVAWQHVSGYLLFCLLIVQAMTRFRRVVERHSWRDSIYLLLFTAVACFTFESGNIVALSFSAALISSLKKDNSYGRFRNPENNPSFGLALALAALPVIYLAASISDYLARFDSFPDTAVSAPLNVFALLAGLIVSPLYWMTVAFFPLSPVFLVGGRLEILSLTFPEDVAAVAASILGLASIVTIARLVAKTLRGKIRRTQKAPLVAVAGMIAGYIILIVAGREMDRGILEILHNNSYYAYIFMMFLTILVFHCITPVKSVAAAGVRTGSHAVLAVLLLALSAVNAA